MSLYKIEKPDQIRLSQDSLVNDLTIQLPSLGLKWITFRPTATEMEIFGRPHGLYFGPRVIFDDTKFWNSFGIFDPQAGRQEITVEINFSVGGSRTAGFFAQDDQGRRFLMHTGGIGGGATGVKRDTFLPWLQPELVAVTSNGKVDAGILIGELGAKNLAQRIESFVRNVRAFKDAVRGGLLETKGFPAQVEQWRDYRKEFSGRKTGTVMIDLDYVSYHGDVVHALKRWVEGETGKRGTVTNSPLIDLLVHRGGVLTDVYEVKTAATRQVLYAGIGQLTVHAANSKARRVLVLPSWTTMPSDIAAGLKAADIHLMHYTIDKLGKISITAR